jgi:hypothetical protein
MVDITPDDGTALLKCVALLMCMLLGGMVK